MSIETSLIPKRPRIDISPKALLKITLWAVIVFLIVKLFTLITLLFLGIMVSVSLEPVRDGLVKRGFSHRLAVFTIAATIITALGLFGFFIFPMVSTQVSMLMQEYPKLKADILTQIPNDSIFKKITVHLLENPKIPSAEEMLTHALAVSNYVFTGVTEFLLVLLFSIYLLHDGEKAYRWFKDFFEAPTRLKIHRTSKEMSGVFLGYIAGQATTSFLSGIYSFALLKFFGVPAAVTLAVIAAVFDILPVLGFFLAVVPAMLLALTISPAVSLYVLIGYIFYHILENYLIAPWVYGSRLEVSSLVVLVALLAAGLIGGVLGAIAILPVVASYPIIEKIWLGPYLGRQVIEKHAEETDPKVK